MKRLPTTWAVAAVFAALLCWVLAAPGEAAEETLVEAFSAWQADGKIYPMGADRAVFQGDLGGVVYVRTDKGPIRAGTILCPGTAEISLTDAAQTGRGQCVYTANDGAEAFARFICEGRHLVGCKGEFTFTGGSGRLEGMSGGGPMVIRSEFGSLEIDPSQRAVGRTATGIMFWPELRITMPQVDAASAEKNAAK